jgi:uncharacterized protein (DUF58 family)
MRSSRPFRFLSDVRAPAAKALARWARQRQGEDAVPLTLRSRRIYILPTRLGLAAALLLFLMLLAGLNYNNSLALLLCFMLCGVALVSMHEGHRTLSGLRLLRAEAEPTFAGLLGQLALHFENADTRLRASLTIRAAPCEPTRFDLPAGSAQAIRLSYQGGERGRQRIDRLELSSSAPLGLFRAWTWLHLPLTAIIYPQPQGSLPLPAGGGDPRASRQRARASGEEEWAWLRPFQDSDPPRSVAWKAFARGGPLMVAHYDAPAGWHRLLDYSLLAALSPEHRLSQLTQWVLECERLGESYSLQLPQRTLAARHGLAQRRLCLEALALYGL